MKEGWNRKATVVLGAVVLAYNSSIWEAETGWW
jgi:hypothetical protein